MSDVTEESLKEALQALPDEPDQVAEELHAMGFVGEKCHPDRCPLANYVCDYLELDEASADKFSVFARGSSGTVDVILPEPLGSFPHLSIFVSSFDNGLYPQLEA